MRGLIDRILTLIAERINKPILNAYGTATIASSGTKNLAAVTLLPNTHYLILGWTNQGVGSRIDTSAEITISGTTKTNVSGQSANYAGSGQSLVCWCYVETGTSSVTATVSTYGYYTTSHSAQGRIVAIPLVSGGYNLVLPSIALSERGCVA